MPLKVTPASSLLCALAFILLAGVFAFSLWAEWGPYSWLAAAQVAIIDSYSEKLTFIVTFVLFLIPAMVLLFVFILGNRVAKAVALGVPGLLILAHLVTTVLFISTGGPQAEATTFDSAVHAASFVPKNITLERRLLPDLRLDQASGVKSTGSADELYIPYVSSSWPSPETRVVLKTSPDNLKKLAAAEKFTGILRKAPLPCLVRSSWPQHPSVFAIILEDRATVRTMFIPAAVVYVFLLIWAAVSFFKSRRARPAPQVAQICARKQLCPTPCPPS